MKADPDFAARLIAWQRQAGRHHLPWQQDSNPYRIWISEIMLQQTQVMAAIPYYQRFLQRFPDVASLAAATLDEVLALWSGLGYYARARNLHKAAQQVTREHGGVMPTHSSTLETLPGIGTSTAAAIAAFSTGERAAILDGNVKRVLARHFAIDGDPASAKLTRSLWLLARELLPPEHPDPAQQHADLRSYTQGLMDLGATVCVRSRPRCSACPLSTTCLALVQGRTDVLPQRKLRKARPERDQTLWLLRRDRQLLLERRPASGIWGGLWSLPEQLPRNCLAVAGAAPLRFELLHEFTHFRLKIAVRELWFDEQSGLVASQSVQDAASAQTWHDIDVALALGLPAPVRMVLEQLASSTTVRQPPGIFDRA